MFQIFARRYAFRFIEQSESESVEATRINMKSVSTRAARYMILVVIAAKVQSSQTVDRPGAHVSPIRLTSSTNFRVTVLPEPLCGSVAFTIGGSSPGA